MSHDNDECLVSRRWFTFKVTYLRQKGYISNYREETWKVCCSWFKMNFLGKRIFSNIGRETF